MQHHLLCSIHLAWAESQLLGALQGRPYCPQVVLCLGQADPHVAAVLLHEVGQCPVRLFGPLRHQ